MAATYSSNGVSRRNAWISLKDDKKDGALSEGRPKSKRTISRTVGMPATKNSSTRDFLPAGPSLKSRLPWLDGKAPSKKPSIWGTISPMPGGFISSSEPTPTTPSSDSSPPPPLPPIPPVPSNLANTGRSGRPAALRRKSMHQQPMRGDTVISSPKDQTSERKGSPPTKTIPMQAATTQEPTSGPHPSLEKTPLKEPWPRKLSLIDSVHPFKSPPSPLSPLSRFYEAKEGNPSQPELRLTKAINRMEHLMQEAESLVQNATESGQPQEAKEIIDEASTALRRASYVEFNHRSAMRNSIHRHPFASSQTGSDTSESDALSLQSSTSSGTKIIKDNQQNRHSMQNGYPLKIHSSQSEKGFIADDDYSSSPSRGRRRHRSYTTTPHHLYEPPVAESVARDFAYPQAKLQRRNRSSSGNYWIGRPPIRKITNLNAPPEPTEPQLKPHTVFIPKSEDPSPRDNGLRQRKLTQAQISPPQPWMPPRHNSMFEPVNKKNSQTKGEPVPLAVQTPRKSKPKDDHNFEARNYRSELDLEKNGQGDDRKGRRGRWHLGRGKREPIARKWSPSRKRFSAIVACINTGIVGYILGVYAGMVPRIQFQLADEKHHILQGNIYMFVGLAVTTFFAWPLPLLHGRKPYILASLALALPLQFPQAILVSQYRSPTILGFEFSLLFCRLWSGLLLGLTNINDFAILLDLYGASLQHSHPHQEIVVYDDPRRDGGGIGLWLGIWTWCWIGSISVGFLSGAGIIYHLNPEWGFYITIIFMACVLVLNIIAPETRRSAHRRSFKDFVDHDEKVRRKVARGEVRLHISDDGPRFWFQELWAGLVLSKRMFFQRGFSVLSLYLGWIYGQNVLVIVLLGALLSRSYKLPATYVGLGVVSIAIGALLAMPLTKANMFSRDRKKGPRTDSMTFERQVTWSSHLVRRLIFMLCLPASGLVYTLVSPGIGVHFMVPVFFAGAIGFFDNLAIAECYGLTMEAYDTCDLQPGVNTRHRLQSMADNVRRRRTNYSSFPRVTAGIFLSQSLGFLFAAAATGVGGIMTRDLGAQVSTGVAAGMLFFLTVLLTMALWRFKSVQVIPNHAFGTRIGTGEWTANMIDEYWKPVVIGNPSGKVRRMSLLELGKLSRWTEIRKLNKLI